MMVIGALILADLLSSTVITKTILEISRSRSWCVTATSHSVYPKSSKEDCLIKNNCSLISEKVDVLAGSERQIHLPAKSLERGPESVFLDHYSLCMPSFNNFSKAMLELSDRVSATEHSQSHLRWEYSGAAGLHVSISCNGLHSGSEHFHSCIQKRLSPWSMLCSINSWVPACYALT